MSRRRLDSIRTPSLALALALAATACPADPTRPPVGPASHTQRDLELSREQAAMLESLAAQADARPDDFAARRASGLAHMQLALSGVLSLQARAERDLEAAFALDPSDPVLNRSLARFYNMRAVAGDYGKADMQVRVYSALLGPEDRRDPAGMDDAAFVAHCFAQLGAILAAKNRGKNLRALGLVGELEDQLAARRAAHPDDIELHALAGNFAFFFAGNIPIDRERRVREAVAAFEIVRARWDEMRGGAKDPIHCPNTYENFMFELAEGHMVLGEGDAARAIYEQLGTIGAPRTRAKELIAHVSSERLRNFDAYLGEMKLMPPWPSDEANCVVCHAWNAEVSLASLYAVEPIALSDVPSRAEYKPLLRVAGAEGVAPSAMTERAAIPEAVVAILESRCQPCHFRDPGPDGQVVDRLDLSTGPGALSRAGAILRRVERGDMPPDAPLDEAERAVIREWVEAATETPAPDPGRSPRPDPGPRP